MTKPAVQLYRYQHNWLSDKSRFKAGCMSRQVGKSFAVALEAVDDAVETGKDWVLLSAGARQSRELMQKCHLHTKAYQMAACDLEVEDSGFFYEDGKTKIQQMYICLPNGARLIGLPANPDTARGFSANTVLDEFGIHQHSSEIWAALFPTISRGYKLRVVSTPKGKSNKFYSVFAGDNNFSKHFVDIYKAVEDGAPHNIEELRAGVDDEDIWQQEFECKFLNEATAFLTYELIAGCESDIVKPEIDFENVTDDMFDEKPAGQFYLGADVGRRKDLTVLWVLERIGDIYITRHIFILNKVKFSAQKEFMAYVFRKLKAVRMCIDSTGIGAMLAESLIEELGNVCVEAVDFNLKTKSDIAMRVLRNFQDRTVRVPISQKVRNDLHNIKKTVTAAGNIRFDAERTKDGHSDRFWALALALTASDQGTKIPECIWL